MKIPLWLRAALAPLFSTLLTISAGATPLEIAISSDYLGWNDVYRPTALSLPETAAPTLELLQVTVNGRSLLPPSKLPTLDVQRQGSHFFTHLPMDLTAHLVDGANRVEVRILLDGMELGTSAVLRRDATPPSCAVHSRPDGTFALTLSESATGSGLARVVVERRRDDIPSLLFRDIITARGFQPARLAGARHVGPLGLRADLGDELRNLYYLGVFDRAGNVTYCSLDGKPLEEHFPPLAPEPSSLLPGEPSEDGASECAIRARLVYPYDPSLISKSEAAERLQRAEVAVRAAYLHLEITFRNSGHPVPGFARASSALLTSSILPATERVVPHVRIGNSVYTAMTSGEQTLKELKQPDIVNLYALDLPVLDDDSKAIGHLESQLGELQFSLRNWSVEGDSLAYQDRADVVAHELGHLYGLDHVPTELHGLMYPSVIGQKYSTFLYSSQVRQFFAALCSPAPSLRFPPDGANPAVHALDHTAGLVGPYEMIDNLDYLTHPDENVACPSADEFPPTLTGDRVSIVPGLAADNLCRIANPRHFDSFPSLPFAAERDSTDTLVAVTEGVIQFGYHLPTYANHSLWSRTHEYLSLQSTMDLAKDQNAAEFVMDVTVSRGDTIVVVTQPAESPYERRFTAYLSAGGDTTHRIKLWDLQLQPAQSLPILVATTAALRPQPGVDGAYFRIEKQKEAGLFEKLAKLPQEIAYLFLPARAEAQPRRNVSTTVLTVGSWDHHNEYHGFHEYLAENLPGVYRSMGCFGDFPLRVENWRWNNLKNLYPLPDRKGSLFEDFCDKIAETVALDPEREEIHLMIVGLGVGANLTKALFQKSDGGRNCAGRPISPKLSVDLLYLHPQDGAPERVRRNLMFQAWTTVEMLSKNSPELQRLKYWEPGGERIELRHNTRCLEFASRSPRYETAPGCGFEDYLLRSESDSHNPFEFYTDPTVGFFAPWSKSYLLPESAQKRRLMLEVLLKQFSWLQYLESSQGSDPLQAQYEYCCKRPYPRRPPLSTRLIDFDTCTLHDTDATCSNWVSQGGFLSTRPPPPGCVDEGSLWELLNRGPIAMTSRLTDLLKSLPPPPDVRAERRKKGKERPVCGNKKLEDGEQCDPPGTEVLCVCNHNGLHEATCDRSCQINSCNHDGDKKAGEVDR